MELTLRFRSIFQYDHITEIWGTGNNSDKVNNTWTQICSETCDSIATPTEKKRKNQAIWQMPDGAVVSALVCLMLATGMEGSRCLR